MSKMRPVQVSRPNGPFEIVGRDIPEPGSGSVRIKVRACGICHSDSVTKDGAMPGIQYPRVPGHEVVGVIDAVGPSVARWRVGQRVGVGWNGGHCGYCDSAKLSPYSASTDSAILTFSLPQRAVSKRLPSRAGKTKEPLARKLGASQYIDWGQFPRIPFIMRYPRSAEGSQAQIRDHS
jgi:Zn-dependent alcohol dehydrogenase